MEKVGVLSGRVITPNRHLAYVVDRCIEFLSDLSYGSVVVESGHCRETTGIKVGGILLSDQRIGIGWVADNKDLDVALRRT